ncbi:hypothetical protein D3C77_419810 [compost metagenome]
MQDLIVPFSDLQHFSPLSEEVPEAFEKLAIHYHQQPVQHRHVHDAAGHSSNPPEGHMIDRHHDQIGSAPFTYLPQEPMGERNQVKCESGKSALGILALGNRIVVAERLRTVPHRWGNLML